MRLRELDAAKPQELAAWLAAWSAWPEAEPFAHPEFARLFARPGDRVVALLGEDPAGGKVLFPLILRPLSAEPWAAPGEDRWDAVSPYGYGGPYAWGERDDAAFWREHAAWARERRILSTFARLSLFPEQLAALPATEAKPPNIVVPLAGGEPVLWKNYEGKVRKWVKTAQEAGVTAEADLSGARLGDFHAVYEHTMTRNQASSWYFFPRSFFDAIVQKMPGSFAFFHALLGGKVVSSDLLLLSKRYAYYFLGGTLEESFPHGPNYLLKHRIACWAAEQGKTGYVLGGGYQENDGLFRYKRAYARGGEVPFRVLTMTHDAAACEELLKVRAAQAGWSPKPGYFPPYRA